MANLQQLCIKEQCGDVTKYTNATQSAAGLMSAADKKKLDEMEPSVPATETPLMDGTGAVGTHVKYAREDHVHPSDTSKQDKLTAGSGINIRESGDNTIIEATGGGGGLKWTQDVDGVGGESIQGVSQNDVENNEVVGKYAIAQGTGTIAEGYASHAEGCGTYTDEYDDPQWGFLQAVGDASHAEGSYLTLVYDESAPEGRSLIASGKASHAEGGGTRASGEYSHAEGVGNEASGEGAHAEGGRMVDFWSGSAQQVYAHYNIASGKASHAEGIKTTANGEAQHVSGINNIPDDDNRYAEIVGIGSYRKSEQTRNIAKNGRTLDWQGREWLAGGLILSAPNNTKYLITVANDGTLITTPFTEY